MRPLSSADIATLKPSPSAPSIASPGTRTPSSESSAVSCARSPSLPFIGLASKPVRARGDEEGADPLRPFPAGAGEDDRRLGPGAERDEDLRAGQHPAVTVLFRARRERGRVGAAARLGQRVAAEPFAAGEARQERLLLLLRPPLRDRLAEEAVRDGDDPAHGRVGLAELLAEQAVRDRVEPAAAELLRQRRRPGIPPRRACRRASGAAPRPRPSRGRAGRARGRRARGRSRGSAPARR